MTALTVTTEETLLIRAREPRAMIKHPICGTVLAHGYFRFLHRLHQRGVSFDATGGR